MRAVFGIRFCALATLGGRAKTEFDGGRFNSEEFASHEFLHHLEFCLDSSDRRVADPHWTV